MKNLAYCLVIFVVVVQYSFSQTISYTSQIKPLFDKYGCTSCHGGNGNFFVSPYASLFTTGDHKPDVVAGDTNSILIRKIKGIAGFGSQMPLGGPVMAAGDLNTIIQWIKNGDPENSTSVDNLTDVMPVHSFDLKQNYPNPFNPSTTFSFNLPSKSFVSLKVFDMRGREIETIISEEMSAGSYTRQWKAVNMPSGVYFYRLQAGLLTESRKLVLLQ
jgi:cytochrome c551/c552